VEAPATQPAAYGDVTIRPIPAKPPLFAEPPAPAEQAYEPELPATFIPPAAERAPLRAPRMPKFEELPMPAQNQIRQASGEAADDHPQKTRLSLLQRLANVGLGRRDDESEPPVAARAAGPAMPPLPDRKPVRPTPTALAGDPVSEYARRPAPQGLDSHGRPAPLPQNQGDDHLDIPAFLRRQSN
jgi:cell division protein FtsZ